MCYFFSTLGQPNIGEVVAGLARKFCNVLHRLADKTSLDSFPCSILSRSVVIGKFGALAKQLLPQCALAVGLFIQTPGLQFRDHQIDKLTISFWCDGTRQVEAVDFCLCYILCNLIDHLRWRADDRGILRTETARCQQLTARRSFEEPSATCIAGTLDTTRIQ